MRLVRHSQNIISFIDLDGVADALVLDSDGNTSISAPTDNQIDIEINAADDFTFTANSFNVLSGSTVSLADSVQLKFGDGDDVTIAWDGTDLDILAAADNSTITVGAAANSFDILIWGSAAGLYFTWDASANDLKFEDSVSIMFGTGAGAGVGNAGDVEMRWDGTNFDILAAANNSQFYIGNGTNSFDMRIFGSAAGNYISWDASANDLKFEDSVSLMFGTGAGAGEGNAGDVEIRWDATDLDILAAADDSVIKFGNGTNSFDIWFYGNAATEYVLWDASADKLSFEGAAYVELAAGSRYSMTGVVGATSPAATDSGTVYVVTGGTGTTFTLPAVATSAGLYFTFVNGADQNMTVEGPAGTLVVFNNTGATSIAYSTASEKVGAAVSAYCNGTKWYIVNHLPAEAATITVA